MHISVQLDSVAHGRLACPECTEVMANADVERLAAKDVYLRFDEIERRGFLEKTPGWRWCLNTECRAGQVHAPLLQNTMDKGEARPSSKSRKRNTKAASGDFGEDQAPKGTSQKAAGTQNKSSTVATPFDLENKDNIFTCQTCQSKACVSCDRPYHDGETCAQYKERRAMQNQAEEAASLETIAKDCKQCPKCSKNIEKDGGCDAVSCEWTNQLPKKYRPLTYESRYPVR